MDFDYTPKVNALRERLIAFMDEHIYPNEKVYHDYIESAEDRWTIPPVMETLKEKAREAGLWNLFLPESERGAGLSNLEYAPLCEIMGRSPIAPEVFNCAAPDTGNMEVLERYGNDAHKEQWLKPLLAGKIRSAFAMTEPEVASSDATNVQCAIERDGDEYVINGRKWWTSGAMDPRCEILIVMGKTDPEADRHTQQSMILVPTKTPGVEIIRPLSVFGYDDAPHGHAEVVFKDGRIHHCMRLIGLAERSLEAMCARVDERVAFGKPLSAQGVVRESIAESRIDIEQARLLTLKAADMMDKVGNKVARSHIAMIKVVAPTMALRVIDRAIQCHGGGGVSGDFMLAYAWAMSRTLRLADGPDEVHRVTIAKLELGAQQAARRA